MASIWHENMLGYLSLDIICSSKHTVCSRKTVHFSEQIISMDKFIPEHIFMPNGGHCLFNSVTQLDLKSNELNNRLLGLSKNPPHGKVEVNSDWEGIFKSHKFKGEYKTEMELQPLLPTTTTPPPPPSLLVPKILF